MWTQIPTLLFLHHVILNSYGFPESLFFDIVQSMALNVHIIALNVTVWKIFRCGGTCFVKEELGGANDWMREKGEDSGDRNMSIK